jgi:hypothetical protein
LASLVTKAASIEASAITFAMKASNSNSNQNY